MKKADVKIGHYYVVRYQRMEQPGRAVDGGRQTATVRVLSTGRVSNIIWRDVLREANACDLAGYDVPEPESETSQPIMKSRKMSGLEAARVVLKKEQRYLTAKEIVALAVEQGLWKSEGATPHATIAAAIYREIKNKGPESRFTSPEKGRFYIDE